MTFIPLLCLAFTVATTACTGGARFAGNKGGEKPRPSEVNPTEPATGNPTNTQTIPIYPTETSDEARVEHIDLPACVRHYACDLRGLETGKHHIALHLEKSMFASGEVIRLTYTNDTPDPKDWITVVPADFEDNSWCPWFWASQASGSFAFDGLPAGAYELRAYYGWKTPGECEVIQRLPFTVR